MPGVGDAPDADIDVLLADGTTARLRPITPDDAEALRAFHGRLSQQSIVLRFFGPHPRLSDAEVERFTHVDGADRVALVAERAGALVAVARYDRSPGSDDAEVAFVVADEFQGRGLGTILLEHLASAARRHGIGRFVADTLSENHRMLHVFRDAGFARQFSRDAEVMRVVLDIAPSSAARRAADERDRQAAVRSMHHLLRPSSIAVIGASRRVGTVGHQLVANILGARFAGPVYAVNPEASSVAGVPAWPTVEEVPGPVELAVVAVPAAAVPSVVASCGRKGVRGLVIVSAGFAEVGEEGAELQRSTVRAAHALGMRVVGPNCFGVCNTDPAVSLNATLSPDPPVAGPVGFASQSGGLAFAVLGEAVARGVGLSGFVSFGNKADVSGNDALLWFEDDPATTVVVLYLESFGNPRRFSRIARRISRSKPIVAVKSGRGAPGDEAVDALFRATGVLRVDTIEELFDVASVLALQPLPRGRRVAVVGDVAGPGTLGADACVRLGLEVPELSAATRDDLAARLLPVAAVANPVDLGATATAEHYRRAVDVLAASGEVDALLAVVTAAPLRPAIDVAAVAAAVDGGRRDLTVVTSVLAGAGVVRDGPPAGLPCFAYPESAARALARVVEYAAWRARPEGVEVDLTGIDPNGARRVLAAAGDQGAAGSDQALRVTGERALAVLRAYGVTCDPGATGGPGAPGPHGPPPVEMVVGCLQDPAFGPLVRVGLGGSLELVGDHVTALAPHTDEDARAMVLSLRGAPLLTGSGADAATAVEALVDVVLRLGRLCEDLPEVAAVECRPVLVTPDGARVGGAALRVAPAPRADDRRRLA